MPNDMKLESGKVSGTATAEGKSPLKVPIGSFGLLARQPGHAKFGDRVFLEDQSASVDEVAAAGAGDAGRDADALAAKFHTTAAHVRQALAYTALASDSDLS